MAIKYVKERSCELSTKAGIMFLLSLLGIKFAPEHMAIVPEVVAVGSAILGIFLREKSEK